MSGALAQMYNGESDNAKRVKIVKANLALIQEAIAHFNAEYDSLLGGLEIAFSDISGEGKAVIESRTILLNSKYIDGTFSGAYQHFVDTLVHEGLHFRVVDVIGLEEYMASEAIDILSLHDGDSRTDLRGEIHDWIYTQGELAAEYSILSSRIATKPNITKAAIKSRFMNE